LSTDQQLWSLGTTLISQCKAFIASSLIFTAKTLKIFLSMANSILVNTTADSGVGSLRAAIAAAKAGDTIRFAAKLANKTISLTSGQLEITKSLTIDAIKAPGLTISGNQASRVFNTAVQIEVVLKNLTIANGKVRGDEDTGAGGGIFTGGGSKLTVINCRINKNSAGLGGGIYSGFQSTTTIINSSFDQNDGSLSGLERGGGAIAGRSDGKLTVKGSSFTRNKGTIGGAINSLLGELRVENSVFLDNVAIAEGSQADLGGYGGAIYTSVLVPSAAPSPLAGVESKATEVLDRAAGCFCLAIRLTR
jgi:Right handed beta helix region